MTEPPIDVERVIREVLAEMGFAPPAPRDPPAGGASGELVVRSRVVTMAELGNRLGGLRRLVVPSQAVVTPSVRDALRRKGITLVYGQPEASSAASPARQVKLVLAAVGSRFDPGPLGRALENEGIDVDVRRSDCLIAATDALIAELGESRTLGVLLSGDPAIALCLANRAPGVRAVWGIDPARTVDDAASVGANLLVVDPGAMGVFQLNRLIGRFCRQGPAECPETLRARLG